MAGVLVSPRFDDRIRKRNALYKKRNESPKFRDVLRERCHARIRASRCALLQKFRSLGNHEELQGTLTGILKEEVQLLTSNTFNTTRLTFDDDNFLLDSESEEDYWLIEEYDKILAEEEANFSFEWDHQVICPMCEISVLVASESGISCIKCKTKFPHVNSLQEFKDHLDMALQAHNENCSQTATFALLQDKELGLFLICDSCMSFSHVL